MRTGRRNSLIFAFVAVFFGWPMLLPAQMQQTTPGEEGEDKYVRLMSAQSVRIVEIGGRTFRKAEGPARFLHNNTWLICDSALWDVDAQIIHANGHVSIEQENTELTSDSLTYFVERDMAEFRGALVQLRDKDNNVLRSNDLDYNTKDSVAVFRGGGAMRDKDGQLIESVYGQYESKAHLFTFNRDVNMFTDSVFIKTSVLTYDSKSTKATFPFQVEAWKDDKMLSSNEGWYKRREELFFFKNDVHMMSETREAWCDSLYYDRGLRTLRMLGNAQIDDRERGVSAMAGFINYTDSISTVRMYEDPVVMVEAEQKKDSVTTKDSVYFRADTLNYWTVKRCDVDSAVVTVSQSRLSLVAEDPVKNIRIKAAEEAAKKAEEAAAAAAENDPNRPPRKPGEQQNEANDAPENPEPPSPPVPAPLPLEREDTLAGGADSLAVASDSLSLVDSLSVKDSLSALPVKDTTKIGFLKADGKVKVFRKTMQIVCDSLWYSDLDSLARLYKDPVIWNETRHQYQSDSVWVVVRDNKMDKANLMSDAFIMINENNVLFDQIKSTEMSAFFDGDSQLRRFDAMGGASAIFYIKEKEELSTANKKEATILSADFVKGELSGITYFENPKSDVYPIAQMKESDKTLKGFSWRPDLRPKSPSDLTSRVLRPSQRQQYSGRSRATFVRTAKYFPGYIEKIYREIARADSLRKANSLHKNDTIENNSLSLPDDTLSILLPDSLGYVAVEDAPELVEDIKVLPDPEFITKKNVDSLAVTDSIAPPSKADLRREKRLRAQAEWEAKRAEKERIRQEKWDKLDARDALRQAKKDARKTARKEALRAKQLARYKARKAREDALREKYKQLYLTKWSRKLLKTT